MSDSGKYSAEKSDMVDRATAACQLETQDVHRMQQLRKGFPVPKHDVKTRVF